MSICFYFHPDGYTTAGRQVMGRHVAGESFLKAALKYGEKSNLWIQVEDENHIKDFESIARSYQRTEEINVVSRSNLDNLRTPGCLYLPGPGIGEWAQHRSRFGNASWSLCGITHTTASTRAMDAVSGLLTAPVQPWDALICTSRAVQNNVRRILEAEADYLRRRLGATKIVLPQLPIIPLGVHAEDFIQPKSFSLKARKRLNIQPDDFVVLFVGRLAFHGKAHPLVMYQALERAASATNRKIVLVVRLACDYLKASIHKCSGSCMSYCAASLDGRDPQQLARMGNTDVFCSLSDDIKTFGITPIEAMAAGIPVVVIDWDGYKDTVRVGIDGFLIQTSMPPPGWGVELASRHALGIDTYDMYCAHASSLVAVDLACTTQAFIKLISSKELRQKMGSNGRQRVLDHYDWKNIIPTYENLWAELNSRRNSESEHSNQPCIWPSRLDPFYAFASYPTRKIDLHTPLRLLDSDSNIAISRFRHLIQLDMVNYVLDRMAPQQQLESILLKLSTGSATSETLIQATCSNDEERQKLFLSITWMIKIGLIEFAQ